MKFKSLLLRQGRSPLISRDCGLFLFSRWICRQNSARSSEGGTVYADDAMMNIMAGHGTHPARCSKISSYLPSVY